MKRLKYKFAFTALLFIVVMNMAITNTICRFKNPKLTQTELALRLHRSFIWDFK